MPADKPKEGDKVSWRWGGGAPGGTVAKTKTEGKLSIQSHRGNTITKKASTENPAVKVKRSGNDVVKRASELKVEKKAAQNGEKRKSDDDGDVESRGDEGNDTSLKVNKDGKEVKANGSNKKQKTSGEQKPKAKAKKSEGKEKKIVAPRSTEGVGSRTRSRTSKN